jgi:hypothetical protein
MLVDGSIFQNFIDFDTELAEAEVQLNENDPDIFDEDEDERIERLEQMPEQHAGNSDDETSSDVKMTEEENQLVAQLENYEELDEVDGDNETSEDESENTIPVQQPKKTAKAIFKELALPQLQLPKKAPEANSTYRPLLVPVDVILENQSNPTSSANKSNSAAVTNHQPSINPTSRSTAS